MKKLTLIAPVLLMGAASVMADDCGITPYVGLDAQLRHTGFKSGFGNNVFTTNYPQGNAYIGLKFNDFLGIEAGIFGGPKRTRSATLNAGDIALGIPLVGEAAETTPIVYTSTTRISGSHINLVGFFPINCDLQAYASVGAARLRARFTNTTLSLAGFSTEGTALAEPLKLARSKTVLRLGLGLQQMLTCNSGVRVGLAWENTRKLNNVTALASELITPNSTSIPTARLKNSLIYSLGVFWQF